MILVDTSVWVDHLRVGDVVLAELLSAGDVLTHPFVVGEIALGSLRRRDLVIRSLLDLPGAAVADDEEVLLFIGKHALGGTGIGYVDAHLLASVRLTAGTSFWTRDRRLHSVAERMDLAVRPPR